MKYNIIYANNLMIAKIDKYRFLKMKIKYN